MNSVCKLREENKEAGRKGKLLGVVANSPLPAALQAEEQKCVSTAPLKETTEWEGRRFRTDLQEQIKVQRKEWAGRRKKNRKLRL